jgi:thymidylate synthase (FAD)
MSRTELNVTLIGHTQMSEKFAQKLVEELELEVLDDIVSKETQALALTAIRTCYSSNKPTEILIKEADKYFRREASDGEGGKEADRLVRHIMRSKHTSTVEHLNYTFAIEGLSRTALAQLTRHRHMSFSVQSQRYVKFGSEDRSGGFDYVVPPTMEHAHNPNAAMLMENAMERVQELYDELRSLGVPAEDARFILPNAAACNLVLTANLRSLLDFYSKRKPGRGAQHEIAGLAEKLRAEVVEADPWTEPFFDGV